MIYNYTQAIRKADTTEINISNQMHKKTKITQGGARNANRKSSEKCTWGN